MRRIFFVSIIISFLAAMILAGIGFFCFSQPFFRAERNFLALIDGEPEATSSAEQLTIDNNNPEVSIIFVGDIMLSRGVAQKIKKHSDYNYSFLKIGDYLKSADFAFGNLETSLFKGREIGPEEMLFRADPELADVLHDFNFSVVSLANNHTMNFGKKALEDTLINLLKVGVEYTGAGSSGIEAYNPCVITKKGIVFAFLAYTDSDVVPAFYFAATTTAGVARMDINKMAKAVKLAKERADFVIVSMHSGTEYKDEPNQRQINFAHAAVDAGADLVIGHHPHIVQTAEKYKDKYIFYSLGNFIFDQRWWKTKEGIALKVIFDKQGIKQIEPQAIYIEDFSQPTLLNEEAAQKVISRLKIVLGQ